MRSIAIALTDLGVLLWKYLGHEVHQQPETLTPSVGGFGCILGRVFLAHELPGLLDHLLPGS